MSSETTRGRAGFSLIEVMAVVIVIGMLMGLVLPNLNSRTGAQLEASAQQIADALKIARERAIVTGAAHRALLDLEVGTSRIDWHVGEERANAHLRDPSDLPPKQKTSPEYSDTQRISLSPPEQEERDYYPIPNRFGREDWLPEDIFFVGVNTADGWIEDGTVQIVFQIDGTTDYSEIVMRDNWENRVVLEVEPLLDVVRMYQEEDS